MTTTTKRMSRRDLESALDYLRRVDIEVHPDPSATSRRFNVSFTTIGGSKLTESMSPRDIWMLARGHRIASK
jgi:hypothetical protein